GTQAVTLLGADAAHWAGAADLELRAAVIRALGRAREGVHRGRALHAVEALLGSTRAAEQAAGLGLARELARGELVPSVLRLVEGGELAVRQEAVACL